MRKIVQIEELRYGRRESYDEAALDEMIECFKNDYEDELPQASLSPFYPLVERTIYQFDEGKLTGSERTFYLLGQQIRSQKFVEWYPDWNREAPTVYYDAKRDEYVVRHIRYDVDKNTPRFISQALAEADYPRKSKDVQAPPETRATAPQQAPQPAPQQRPVPQPTPQPKPQPTVSTEYHKPWRQKRLTQLMIYYKQGYTAKEIADEMECLESSVYYQLEHYLNVANPFAGGWISRHDVKPISTRYVELKSPTNSTTREQDLSNNGTKWTEDEDYNLLREFFRNISVEKIAIKHKRSIHSIYARLNKVIGLPNPLHPEELTPQQKIKAEKKWQAWLGLKAQWEQEAEQNRERNQEYRERQRERQEQKRQERQEFLKDHTPDGFYRPGVHIKHSVWGNATVIKDNEDVLKLLLSDGTKKVIKK